MTSANMADGTNITYSYDGLGNRRAKTVNGEITNYLTVLIFGMSHVLAELASDNTIKNTYIYAGPQLLKEEPSTTLIAGGLRPRIFPVLNITERDYFVDYPPRFN